MDHWGQQPIVDDLLDLLPVPRGDVGDGPAALFTDGLLGVGQQLQQAGQCPAVQNHLRLVVVPSDNVPHRPQGGRLHQRGGMQKEFHQAPAHAGLDDCGDALIGAIRQVGQGPARICQHFHIRGVDELGQRAQGRRHPLEGWGRLTTAKIGQGPGCVPHHRGLFGIPQDCHHRMQATALQNQVSEVGGVSCDVPQRPNGLLPHIVVGRLEELHEDGQRAMLHHYSGLVRVAGGDVG
mmetsp:Transcript_97848/g.232983  ORF Transcript_97848/g.232983 Transcript_97848/m.232983 type:complete len:236 (-) Transcript_97848:457-1164(-)